MGKLSEHFSVDEAVASSTALRLGIDNSAPAHIIPNLKISALGAEQVRACLADNQMRIDSWYRCDALNKAVGGSTTSDHPRGFALDFVCPDFGAPAECVGAIAASDIQFDQLIQEGTWVHISFAPAMRRQVLTAVFKAGQKTTYINGINSNAEGE